MHLNHFGSIKKLFLFFFMSLKLIPVTFNLLGKEVGTFGAGVDMKFCSQAFENIRLSKKEPHI